MKNHVLIKISSNEDFATKVDNQNFSAQKFSMFIERNPIFEFDQLNYSFNQEIGIVTAVLGYFSNWDELKQKYGSELKSDVELMEKKYLSEKAKDLSNFTSDLDGVYLVIIYSIKDNQLFIFQSIFGYALPIYYTVDDQKFTLSTSLKSLLQNTNLKRELDYETASAFIGHGLVHNERTLIKNVNKLVTHTYLRYDLQKNTFDIKWSSNILAKQEESYAKASLVPSISENIKKIAKSLRDKIFYSTLTRGWDTNLILSQLKGVDHQGLKLFSIDGGNEFSEVEEVREILKNYENTELAVHEIDIKTLDRLPDIVWRYEGFVFEMGIFLRYDLANYLLKGKTNHVFVGSGADPVLDSTMGPGGNNAFQHYGNSFYKNFFYDLKKRMKGGIIGDIWFGKIKKESEEARFRRKQFNPNLKVRYNFEIEYNLKMHDILFNSFNVSGLYPFLNKKTVAAANSIRKYNIKKAFYKEQLKELFGEKITSVIKKTGKVLDTDRLYFEKKDLLLKFLDKPLLADVIGTLNVNRIKLNPDKYKSIIPQLAYLYVFNQLFLSKDFDKYFNNEKIENQLEDFI